jgi:hypothetical protein
MDHHTADFLKGIVTTAFIGTWILLGIAGFIAFRLLDTAAKRRWMPRWGALVAVLFVVFSTALSVLESRSWSGLWILILVVPGVVLIAYLNNNSVKFCDKCDAFLWNYSWFTPMRFCSRCGALLDTSKPSRGDSLLE